MQERIKHLRITLELSQKEFGKRTNLSQNQICLMERGHRRITKKTLIIISNEFNISMKWLLSGEGSMFKSNYSLSLEINELFQYDN